MRFLYAAGVLLGLCAPLRPQSGMPAWLTVYPGASATFRATATRIIASYIAAASPEEVREHYRKLFEGRGLPFQPAAAGADITIQAGAECDLTITIRALAAGSTVQVSCAERENNTSVVVLAPGAAASNQGPSYRSVTTPAMPSGMPERHQELVAATGIHRRYEDAPAPPLIWPDWLVGVDGARLRQQRGVDQSHNDILRVEYRTSVPMTKVFAFYKDLLDGHGYPVHSSQLGTGHTTSGVQQNAEGHVEGANYPNGTPGPRTEIRVVFSRFHLNEPIRVTIKFTTYAFQAPKTSLP